MSFNYIQTFFINADAVNSASHVFLTSVEIFVKTKPTATNNISGVENPGIVIEIFDATANGPSLTSYYQKSITRMDYTKIYASSDASISTKFIFADPIPLAVGSYYGISLLFEDDGYDVWTAVSGDRTLGTNSASPGATGNYVGSLYDVTTSSFSPKAGTDLKFNVNIAQFTSNTVTIPVVSDNFEFLTVVRQPTKVLTGGEAIWQVTTNKSGNLQYNPNTNLVVGVGTSFLTDVPEGSYVALYDDSHSLNSNTQIATVQAVVNNTCMYLSAAPFNVTSSNGVYCVPPVAFVHDFNWSTNSLILKQSTANSTNYFTNGSTLFGDFSKQSIAISTVDDKEVNLFNPNLITYAPPSATISITDNFAYNSNGYAVNSQYASNTTLNSVNIPDVTSIYQPIIMSRSHEVTNNSSLYNQDVSAVFLAQMKVSNTTSIMFDGPLISNDALDILFYQTNINDDSSGEETNAGNSYSRHITTKIPIANNSLAEDLLFYVDAYLPASTNLACFAKVYNSQDSDSFDDKIWTRLVLKSGQGLSSPIGDLSSTVQLTFGLPQYPPSNNTISGTVTAVGNSAILNGIGTNFTGQLANNQLIKIYNPLFPQDYQVAVVAQITNTTQLILQQAIVGGEVSESVQGTGRFVDVLSFPGTCFNNILNDNVARYYNSSMVEFDGYDTIALKICSLSNSNYIVPVIQQISAVATSA